jgi:hypothetical protein
MIFLACLAKAYASELPKPRLETAGIQLLLRGLQHRGFLY